eukprot:14728693-Ditylum_brightwellii.AAC.1
MKKRSYSKMQAGFNLCITKIITTVNLNNKMTALSASQSVSSASSTSFEAYKRHMDSQEKFPGG